ncbi:MAG: 16S rRNA (guanine(527)-N(7))-methyltransferase RsmG [Gorillibacterium sp.]|nr:16S rRNA (guanine(527)-N(7))-methyltransferase RsmG [Gorillibacterium sp.]
MTLDSKDPVEMLFEKLLLDRGIELSDKKQEQFRIYYRELLEWNEKTNLTGITEQSPVYIKHFYDSISLAFFMDFSKISTMADIGSGAGFPSLPLKIIFPELKVTIVDSLNKRILFLKHLTERLQLADVNSVHGRAEDIAHLPEHRDHYDLVTARAVAKLNVLNEFCLPFVRVGGIFAAMKGVDPTEELQECQLSLKELRGEHQHTYSFTLPIEEAERHIIVIKKRVNTPVKYPRKAGIPMKTPLV